MLSRTPAKFRADSTTSERQLIVALADSRRNIALSELVGWRKNGLLPPLASTGTGSGRCYYWREPDIQRQAETAYDALQRHGRMDMAIITLWLHGFAVQLPPLRRAWLYRGKRAWAVNPGTHNRPVESAPDGPAADISHLLLQALFRAGAPVGNPDSDRAIMPVLEAALERLGLGDGGNLCALASELWRISGIFTVSMESSTLVRDASDHEMLAAHRYLRAGMDFLKSCRQDRWTPDMIEGMAHRAFVVILTLLRSGQKMLLEAASARIESASLRRGTRPDALVYARL